MSKDGLCAIVTGSASGLGAATAQILATQGARLIINYSNSKAEAEATAEACRKQGAEVLVVQGDVSRDEDCKKIAAAAQGWGRLDVLVNNAGLMPIRPMAEVNTDEWDQMIDVNLKGALYGIAAALPGFLEQGSGHIINLSSVAGIKVFAPGGTVYSGTKFAVSAISEGLRQEVGEKVRVTSIEPGAVESDLKFTTSGTAAETVLDFYKQAIPAASVARAIAFAVEQPDDVDINAIVIRPTAQQF